MVYYKQRIETIDSPSLVIYPQRVKENIQKLIQMAGNVELLRPHVKTNKMAEVCKLMLDAGITRFKCATIAEAEMLGMIGAPDVLIAHQPTGPKIERLLKLVTTFRTHILPVLLMTFATVQALSKLFTAHGERIQAFIDVNIGMNRSGVIPEKALQLFKDAQAYTSIRIIGLHAYDGHIRDTDLTERSRRSDEAFAK
jgi:D-serine deaminase-like pyridoxal phosphate-dependent protein